MARQVITSWVRTFRVSFVSLKPWKRWALSEESQGCVTREALRNWRNN
jgi:hypothetical protein